MTWTTPEIERPERVYVADERTALEAALDFQRATFLFKCGGLTGEQLTLRPVGRSTLSLLGLARHLAGVERWWFRNHLGGDTDLPWIFFTKENLEGDFNDGTPESAPGDFESYHQEVAAARAVIAGCSLDDTFRRPSGELADLRWLFLNLTEEYARHNGHADLVREHIDGRTGE
ncbi:MAG: DinB family protein [Streptomyces sp.]|uniref:DinB family protein n=1 Tax=Streptomyces sp. TaxID=1931 RepID=UPI003D6BA431